MQLTGPDTEVKVHLWTPSGMTVVVVKPCTPMRSDEGAGAYATRLALMYKCKVSVSIRTQATINYEGGIQ